MDKLIEKLRNKFTQVLNFDGAMRIILFLIPLIAIVFKSILFQGFVVNQDPYSLNLNLGYSSAKPFINYYYVQRHLSE